MTTEHAAFELARVDLLGEQMLAAESWAARPKSGEKPAWEEPCTQEAGQELRFQYWFQTSRCRLLLMTVFNLAYGCTVRCSRGSRNSWLGGWLPRWQRPVDLNPLWNCSWRQSDVWSSALGSSSGSSPQFALRIKDWYANVIKAGKRDEDGW